MLWSEIDINPSSRTVRQFAAMWFLFLGALAIWQTSAFDRWQLGVALMTAAVLGGLAGALDPAWLRLIYVGGMVLSFPISWVVSQTLLAILYFGLVSPLALILKLTGRDPLRLRRPSECASYWSPTPATTDVRRYLRTY